MPYHHVIRFHADAPMRAASTTICVTLPGSAKPLAMVFAFGALINRMSAAAAQLFFYAFAAAMGLSLAWIFQVFTGVSIAQTFLITAIAFVAVIIAPWLMIRFAKSAPS